MLSIKNFLRRLKSPYNYNIGFVAITPAELISHKGFGNREIEWMKHDYSDRWFADPFILDANENEIVILSEEKIYGQPGSLVKLTVSVKGKKLITRHQILDLDTHLSYPAIYRNAGKVYVYPENSASRKLNLYEMDDARMKLNLAGTLINAPLADSTIYRDKITGKWFLIATNIDIHCHNYLQLYSSSTFEGPWHLSESSPVVTNVAMSRPGGDFFEVDGELYRPAQDCNGEYGNSLHIMHISSFLPYKEEEVVHLTPMSFKYAHGIHTLNFHESGWAVVDGNGYAYPIAGRILGPAVERICCGLA